MDTIKEALTFDDVLLLPKYSNVLPSNTDIFLNLTKKISLKVPFFTSIKSSPMKSLETNTPFGLSVSLEKLIISIQS